jgi:surfeit locus 1 family protein
VRHRAARLACVTAIAVFVALGIWQVERRAWKHALIARVERHLAAAPAPAPGPAAWTGIDAADAYRRVRLHGRFAGAETETLAVTELGAGHWRLAPFRDARGFTVLVNRGFVPKGQAAAPPPGGPATVTGLLRLDEPGGGFLRGNDPANGRWYSRDVRAIARARGVIGPVAPYFVDADADAQRGAGWPRGGLTVVRFRDSHLVYALTWFAMAAMTAILAHRAFGAARH